MALTTIDDRGLKTPIDLLDNEKIRFGTGNDLEIYHDGTSSYVVDTTSDLYLQSTNDDIIVKAADDIWCQVQGGENAITMVGNGKVELFYDNSLKFETTSYGSAHTGIMRFENSGDGISLYDSRELKLGSGDDLKIYHDGSNSYVQDDGVGDLILKGSEVRIQSGNSTDTKALFKNDGPVELYYNNVKTFETVTDGIKVLGNEGGAAYVYMSADEGDDNADKWVHAVGTDGVYTLRNYTNGSSWETNIRAVGDGAVELYYDNSKKLETKSYGTESTGYFSIAGSGLRYGYTGGDNVLISLGDSNDLQIYHDGSNSFIKDGGTGSLWTYTNDFRVASADGSENIIKGTEDAEVALYYDNAKTFQTKAHGIQITGGEGASADILWHADEGDDNADKWYQYASTDGKMVTSSYASGSWVNKLEIQSGGDVKVSDGDLVIGTAGHGISFAATGGPSNGSGTQELLDDYEEGTWTPAYGTYGGASSGTKTYDTNAQNGFYVKIGCVVRAWFDFSLTSWSGASGTGPTIYGFPFTKNFLGSQSYYYSGLTIWTVSNAMSGSATNFSGYMANGDTNCKTFASSTAQQSTVAPMNVVGRISGCLVYTTSS